jgi:hypothetical protein
VANAPDQHLLGKDDEGTVDFVAGSMVPSHPFDREGEKLILKLYDQEGNLQNLPVADTKANEIFGVWLRRFDRYSGPKVIDHENDCPNH